VISERVKLRFADLEIEFVDRVRGIQQVIEYSERGTWHPVVVFGPEGCGKSAWLKQTVKILRESGFEVIYVDPMFKEFIAETNVKDVIDKLIEAVTDVIGVANLKLATLAIDLTKELLKKWRKRKVALLVDDVFQAIGLDRAEVYVKSLLNLIEYPPADYDKIITIVVTSEGLSRWRIGRHRWAEVRPIWNLGREGF
jgi:archaellum biogenesis ATPase FlaH